MKKELIEKVSKNIFYNDDHPSIKWARNGGWSYEEAKEFTPTRTTVENLELEVKRVLEALNRLDVL